MAEKKKQKIPGPPQKKTKQKGRAKDNKHPEKAHMNITEPKRAKAELPNREDWFRSSFANASVGFGLATPDGRFLEVNPAYCKLTGYEYDELRAMTYTQIVHPDDLAENMKQVEQLLVGKSDNFIIENRYVRKDGEIIWVRKSVSLVRHPTGEPAWIIALIEDITSRKEVEDKLEREKERLQLALEGGLLASWDRDFVNDSIVWDEKLYDLLGRDPHGPPVTGDTFFEYIHPEDRPRVLERVEKWLEEGDTFQDEFRVIREDEEIVWLGSSGRVYRDQTGRPVRMAGVNHDITERKLVEKALRDSERRYRSLFESIDEGFCIIEVIFDESEKPIDYRFLDVNPSFEKQTGLANAQGKRMRELAPKHEEYWFEIYGRIALTGEPARFQHRAAHLNRFYDVYAFRYGGPEDHQVAILFSDISERKLGEEALRESEKTLRVLLNLPNDSILLIDTQGNLLTLNEVAAKRLKGTPDGLTGHNIYAMLPGEVAQRRKQFVQQAIRTGEPVYFEDQRAGMILEHKLFPIIDKGGQVTRIAIFGRDVTASRKAEGEREVRLSRQSAFSAFSTHILSAESEAELLHTAANAARMLTVSKLASAGHGYAEGQFLSGTASRAEDIPACPEGREFAMERGGVYMDLLESAPSIRLTDEEMRSHPRWWGLPEDHVPLNGLLATRLIGRDGSPNGLIMVSHKEEGEFTEGDERALQQLAVLTSLAMQKIEARRELEESLERQREILQSTFEHIPVMLCFYDADGKVSWVNEEMERLTGYSMQEYKNMDVMEKLYPDPQYRKEVWEYMMKSKIGWHDFRVRTRYGTDLESSWSNVMLSDGSQIGIGIDITERKKAETALKHLSSRLLETQETERRNLALELHDGLGGSLLGIKMAVEKKLRDIKKGKAFSGSTILEEILELIQSCLRDSSRIQHNLRPSVLDHLGVAAALRSLCREFGNTHKEIRATCTLGIDEVKLPEELKIIVYRISQEALTNVAKHSQAENVSLSLTEHQGEIRLVLQDDGRGFDVEEGLKPEKLRRGIGIASMKERCALSGGTFSVDSRNGIGTAIRCTWPTSS
jgi:PAS domain S-box-containing protein